MSEKTVKKINLVVHPGFVVYKKMLELVQRQALEGWKTRKRLTKAEKEFLRRYFANYGKAVLEAVRDPETVTVVVFHPEIHEDAQRTDYLIEVMQEIAKYNERFEKFVAKHVAESGRVVTEVIGGLPLEIGNNVKVNAIIEKLEDGEIKLDGKRVEIHRFGEWQDICVYRTAYEIKERLERRNPERRIAVKKATRFGAVHSKASILSRSGLRKETLRMRKELKLRRPKPRQRRRTAA